MDPGKTLKSILAIISKDVRLIKRDNVKKKLDAETALTLSRYASTLNTIVEAREKAKEAEKKRLGKLPLDEMVKRYLEEKKQKEAKPK